MGAEAAGGVMAPRNCGPPTIRNAPMMVPRGAPSGGRSAIGRREGSARPSGETKPCSGKAYLMASPRATDRSNGLNVRHCASSLHFQLQRTVWCEIAAFAFRGADAECVFASLHCGNDDRALLRVVGAASVLYSVC